MKDILETICDYAKIRVARDKENISFDELVETCKCIPDTNAGFLFENALKKDGMSFICEVKKASPSKGVISEDFPYLDIAKDYENAGADCISCLTEPKWFLGSDKIFTDIRSTVKVPMIRKDFVIDEYQIYQAKAMGANAVLLICSVLDDSKLNEFFNLASQLGLASLVETHNEKEILRAKKIGAKIIGVNNRNLRDFSVDITNSSRYRCLVDSDTVFVAESGIKSPSDIAVLKAQNVDAVLVGETLMRANNKADMLNLLRGA